MNSFQEDEVYIGYVLKNFELALERNQDYVYIGHQIYYGKEIDLNISRKSWLPFIESLYDFALDEEYYERCRSIKDVRDRVTSFLKESKQI